jgi:hypothetical protein
MRTFVLLALGLGVATLPQSALAQHRQLGAHEHGRGTLNIAIEGPRVSMELEAPGADIVGFEHAARTARQKTQVEQAKKQLLAPQTLFKFPDAAGCVVADASVDIEGDEHEHEAPGGGQKKADDVAAERSHSNFHGQFAFTCNAPAAITAVDFGYFRAFAGAQKLEVNVITSKGQTTFEVTRAKPRIDLAGMM